VILFAVVLAIYAVAAFLVLALVVGWIVERGNRR
jgi:hypothetical protein